MECVTSRLGNGVNRRTVHPEQKVRAKILGVPSSKHFLANLGNDKIFLGLGSNQTM
jgi:hypothetical protein